jgi:hypothetical protein
MSVVLGEYTLGSLDSILRIFGGKRLSESVVCLAAKPEQLLYMPLRVTDVARNLGRVRNGTEPVSDFNVPRFSEIHRIELKVNTHKMIDRIICGVRSATEVALGGFRRVEVEDSEV